MPTEYHCKTNVQYESRPISYIHVIAQLEKENIIILLLCGAVLFTSAVASIASIYLDADHEGHELGLLYVSVECYVYG
jgi:hypothetical protein